MVINPATPAEAIQHVLDLVDLVLVMSVNPGFGGQAYIASTEPKVTQIRRWILERGLDVDIEVDGGVSPTTAPAVVAAGGNFLVAGSALFNDPLGLASCNRCPSRSRTCAAQDGPRHGRW